MNPTTDVFEKRIAELEGGVAALAVASGQAAETLTVLNLARAGDNLVSSQTLYGGTYNLFAYTLPKWGITTKFVDIHNLDAVRQAIDDGTRLLYVETIGNPRLDVPDFEALAEIAHAAGHPAGGGQHLRRRDPGRPIKYGADIVVHSATKWIGGHGTAIGGVGGGRRQVRLGQPDRAQARFPSSRRPIRPITAWSTPRRSVRSPFIIKLRVQLLRDLGPALSPFNAFLFLQGLETLPLRIQRHSENALAVARWLAKDARVEWVSYPGLESPIPSTGTPRATSSGGFGGVLTFGVKGGHAAAKAVIDRVKLLLAAGQRGRRQVTDHPPGVHHARAAHPGAADARLARRRS